MSTHKISYIEGEEASLDSSVGMAVAAVADVTADIEVNIFDTNIDKDAAIAGLYKIINLIRDNDYPIA
jgi:hypothetical protein